MREKVDKWEEEHETSCNQLGDNLKDQCWLKGGVSYKA